MYIKILVFCWLTHQIVCNSLEIGLFESIKKKNVGYLFSMPNTLIDGKNETVCVSVHDSKLPTKILVDLKWNEKHMTTSRSLQTEYTCFSMHIPLLKVKEPNLVTIRLQIQLNGKIYSSHNQDPVLLYPDKTDKTLIETDRSTYKPGDKVRIRILTLNEKLLPINKNIPEIRLQNPLGITVAIWENLSSEFGLVHLEHQMVQESFTGTWKLIANGVTRNFQVDKYVLPRFKVYLFYPKRIYFKKDHIKIKVCAKYSYGKNVIGKAFIKVIDSFSNMKIVYKTANTINGCSEFEVSNMELNLSHLKSSSDPKLQIFITATVIEEGTSKIEMQMTKSIVTFKPFDLKFVTSPIFHPGLPYKGKVQLSNINVELKDEVIEICYNVAIKKSYNYLNNEQCRNFTITSDNSVDFTILPMKNNIIHIHINARSISYPSIDDRYLAVRLYSSDNNHILIEESTSDESECKKHQEFTVIYSTENMSNNDSVTFYYLIKSQDEIYKLGKISRLINIQVPDYLSELKNVVGGNHKYIKLATPLDKFRIKFKLDNDVVNKYELLVYHITENGETIAATKSIEFDPCLPNKVEASWQKTHAYPGSKVALNIKTNSDSLCSISSVDKSSTYFGATRYPFNINSLLKDMKTNQKIVESNRKICVNPTGRKKQVAALTKNDEFELRRRRRREVFSFAEDYDALDIFNVGPLFENRNIDRPVEFIVDADYDDQTEDGNVGIRSFFPETWLWDLEPISSSNVSQIYRTLPHTITSWVTNVLCVSQTEGIGFSKEFEVTGFQPFFIDVLKPYSIRRNEYFSFYVNIFNYLSYNLPINIKLSYTNGLELRSNNHNSSVSYCVSANGTIAHLYTLKGIHLGMENVTVSAEIASDYPDSCGPESVVYKRDVVQKSVLIEPDGYPIKITKSALLCASETQTNITWDFNLPEALVPDTDKLHLVINGDILGPTIENLEDLLSIPMGCGEQIMASIAPNLYVLRYLKETNNLTPSMKARIIKNLKMGYQKILNYIHKDGSFSAFGYFDPAGSMFLTAFAVRTLQEAKQYIYVDQRIIEKASKWILEHQLENGCFNSMLHVFQDMGGASSENSTASLTAYVLISLLEGNIKIPDTILQNAQYCIRSTQNPDVYALAISSYSLFKIKWITEADKLLNRLLLMSSQHQNMIWWSGAGYNDSVATDIEITSYALLSLLEKNTTESLANAYSIVRWLSSKHGPYGGFKSTQDTVIALDALTKYAKFMNENPLNIVAHITAKNQHQKFKIEHKDKLKTKKMGFKHTENSIIINVDGEGCVLIQATQSYHMKKFPENDAFKLDLKLESVSNIDQCSIAALSPCLAYTGPGNQSNMAVLEVFLPSGYSADRASLYKLIEEENQSKVKKFEEMKDKIVLYFTKLSNQHVCFTFNINENTVVETRKDSAIKLYDYYKPEYEIVQFYKMNTSCDFNGDVSEPIEDLVDVSSNNEKTKREAKYNPNDNFVNMNIDLDTPKGMEGNRPVYLKPSDDLLRNMTMTVKPKRDINDLNPSFIDMDLELEMPKGLEQNKPSYIEPSPMLFKNMTSQMKTRN